MTSRTPARASAPGKIARGFTGVPDPDRGQCGVADSTNRHEPGAANAAPFVAATRSSVTGKRRPAQHLQGIIASCLDTPTSAYANPSGLLITKALSGAGTPERPRILAVVGTRPEVIKMAPVIRALSQEPTPFEIQLCVVSQHTDILQDSLEEFDLSIDFRVPLQERGELTTTLAQTMIGVRGLLAEINPACVLVQGDTSTTLAASLAAFYSKVPVAHIEAGLRTGNMHEPFPEEMHRVVASSVADVLYAPTEQARLNLIRECFPADRIVLVGNTVVDALPSAPLASINERRVLVTCHRRENFGAGIESVCRALQRLLQKRNDILIDFVLHPNPLAAAIPSQWLRDCDRLTLHPPMSHSKFVALIQRSTLVVTDSGGVQEESACLARPALILRKLTDRMESVEAGAARVVGTDPFLLVNSIEELIDQGQDLRRQLEEATAVYGDGKASWRIREDLTRRFATGHGEHDGSEWYRGNAEADGLAD